MRQQVCEKHFVWQIVASIGEYRQLLRWKLFATWQSDDVLLAGFTWK